MIMTFKKMGSTKFFYQLADSVIPWFKVLFLILLSYGLIAGLVLAPPDYQQGDAFRIIYIHVPSAVLSIFIYLIMAGAAAILLIWRLKIADIVIQASTLLGASFTLLALITGSIWGKPMWGTWWVWDARLTSELILFFLYLGVIALRTAIPNQENAGYACSILLIVGVVNIPIIHYSVYWWNTLHQGATFRLLGPSLIAPSMLYPLIAMLGAFFLFYLFIMLMKSQKEILLRESRSAWVKDLK